MHECVHCKNPNVVFGLFVHSNWDLYFYPAAIYCSEGVTMLNTRPEQFKTNFAKLSKCSGGRIGNIYSDYSFY